MPALTLAATCGAPGGSETGSRPHGGVHPAPAVLRQPIDASLARPAPLHASLPPRTAETDTLGQAPTAAEPPPSAPTMADCRLANLSPSAQLGLLERVPVCTAAVIDGLIDESSRYLDVFLAAIGSRIVSDRLWQATYRAHVDGRLRFAPSVVDRLLARMPGAIATCAGGARCSDWAPWILGPLSRGEMYACPTVDDLGVDDLLASLPYGNYACTETTIAALASMADASTVARLVNIARDHPFGWGRRNGLRALGRFSERDPNRAPGLAVVRTYGSTIAELSAHAVRASQFESEVHDAIWLLDTFFHPYFAGQTDLEQRALSPRTDAALRFRAIAAWSRLVWADPDPLDEADVAFIESALAFDDDWVQAQAAYTVELLSESRLTGALQARIEQRLDATLTSQTSIVARAYVARALDRLQGTSRLATVKTDFEALALPHTATTASVTLRTGLAAGETPYWLGRITAVQRAFFDGLGATVSTPVRGDPNARWTVVVFANREDYRSYMQAFVGFGAFAGGLYIERRATLYTYQRPATQSSYTLEELLQHELTHGLTGRYIFVGIWGDPGFHREPKGWLDEGLAEVLAGLVPNAEEPFPLRAVPLAPLCNGHLGRLQDLLERREGYDRPGTFDYAQAWAFVYYLYRYAPAVLSRIITSFRTQSYRAEDFARIANVHSVADLQADWHDAVQRWCAEERAPRRHLHVRAKFARCASHCRPLID